MPGWRAIKELGVRRVIRGQRKDEDHKGVIRNGTVFEGIEFVCPLEDWSAEDVFSYLEGVGADVPPYYGAGEVTSRDCWDCTAFLDVSNKRIDNLPEERRREVKRRLSLMSRAVIEESKWLKADSTPTLPA
jgi:phosphoadenosine phosphosulfate reductase